MSAATTTSTDPDPGSSAVTGPRLGVRGWARFLWRQLTSMRTALLLLLLVAVAAIPGSVFPQRSIDLTAVQEYLDAHPRLGPVLDTLQMFDVYTSVWFSAAYLLLIISLVGCIIPRTARFFTALAAPPPAVPRRPERLGVSVAIETSASPAEVEREARALLRRRRYRLRRPDDALDGTADDDHDSLREVAAEAGHLREAGNILFHYGVVAVTLALAAGYLVGWKGDRIVPVGESFANTRSAYHTFSGGPLVDGEDLQPFVVKLDSMTARFEDRIGAGELGAPRDFTVHTTIRDTPTSPPRQGTLRVNEPLEFEHSEVYLLGNGYAPVLTVRDAAGKVLYRQATPFLPHDGNYRSTGAVKVPAASPKHLGFTGVFLPTVVEVGDQGKTSGVPGDTLPQFQSGFPDLNDPMLVLSVYEGNLFPDAEPQSVYQLQTRGMQAVTDAGGQPLRLQLRPGQRVQLPGGRGSVELESVDRWAGISTRYDPVKGVAMWSAFAMLLGLLGSLVIPRRRVFLRARTTSGEPETSRPAAVAGDARPERRTHVVLAGMAQREDANLGDVLTGFAEDLVERLPRASIIEQTDSRTDRS